MSSDPISHFVVLQKRPIVRENDELVTDSLKLHYWEWKGQKPTILFCHGASFHSRCYDRVINEALSGFHVISIDLRGHGLSQSHPAPCDVRWLGEDVLQFIELVRLCDDDLIGIAHSLGGYAITYAAAIAPKRLFKTLLLLDPGIIPRSMYGIGEKHHKSLEYILRRKDRWSSMEEMFSRLEHCEPFRRWDKNILHDYCKYALGENGNLTCTSQFEHSLYQSGLDANSNIYPYIEQSRFIHEISIHLIRSSLPFVIGQFETSPTAPDLSSYFKNCQYTYFNNLNHFFPMEKPEIVINLIKDVIKNSLRSHL